eukprot:TRINITY_DN2751_c0_g1_i2.p1 TRINITY_DN2751_c0_g1~~TRINITY_DN2751_c0_g1_i2.p1  ORF type:complete len:436 (-),score=98.18 TRINITY_DN2751_c0_g1_i2:16-1323(-)
MAFAFAQPLVAIFASKLAATKPDLLPQLFFSSAAAANVGASTATTEASTAKTLPPHEGPKTVVIVGGGTAGITVAAQLLKYLPKNDSVVIVDPADKHYYQPLWTLVAGGIFSKEDSQKDMSQVIPAGAKWVKQTVVSYEPEKNKIKTDIGDELNYDYLVVASGIQPDYDKVKGLRESLHKNGVCTIYDYKGAEEAWNNIKNFKGGVALFTFPSTPIKCAGAPVKITFLAEDYFRNTSKVRDNTQISYFTPLPSIFGVKKYADVLMRLANERNVSVNTGHGLIEVRGNEKEAVFNTPNGQKTIKYDLLHVALPMQPPPAVAASPLAAGNGYVDVDQYTLQHKKYPNVFAVGDCANVPTSKTAAAITQQAPAVVANLISVAKGKVPQAKYDGYTSCPLVVSYSSLSIATTNLQQYQRKLTITSFFISTELILAEFKI